MERFNKPSMSEIFDALADEDTYPDWDAEILETADKTAVQKVKDLLIKGLPLSEARIELRDLEGGDDFILGAQVVRIKR